MTKFQAVAPEEEMGKWLFVSIMGYPQLEERSTVHILGYWILGYLNIGNNEATPNRIWNWKIDLGYLHFPNKDDE